MARQRLTATPSSGQSEVLWTLRKQGAIHTGIRIQQLVERVSMEFGGDNDRELSDTQFTADVQTVVAALATAGLVSGHDANGNAVDLTAAQALGSYVALTGTGRVAARAPRPRRRYLRG